MRVCPASHPADIKCWSSGHHYPQVAGPLVAGIRAPKTLTWLLEIHAVARGLDMFTFRSAVLTVAVATSQK
eukprot:scaffold69515_cov58-Attheya_sp.AAC.1